jgi:hypothetical protein
MAVSFGECGEGGEGPLFKPFARLFIWRRNGEWIGKE